MWRLVYITTISLLLIGNTVDSQKHKGRGQGNGNAPANRGGRHQDDPDLLLYRQKRKDNINEQADKLGKVKVKKSKKVKGDAFRARKKPRGSKENPNIKPKPIPHKPFSDDPPGCGNPICVVIDLKPRRFPSICQFIKYLKEHGRTEQMNFMQKGDCYDIIDGEGADEKPWVSEDVPLENCGSCNSNEYCNTHITLNIDLANMLYGQSSAFGGQLFHETKDGGSRLVGIPAEFTSVCEALQYIKCRDNLNINTQVLGIAIGKKDDLFPMNSNSEKCLWSEWFDHDTPCNSGGDTEKHTDHWQRLQETETGPLRICRLNDIVLETQYEGGSEITRVSADDAKKGTALGSDGTKFKQMIEHSKNQLVCKNGDQETTKLPPPFIYAEGLTTDPKENAACLDYKARYCCKSNTLYRPVPVTSFEANMPKSLPMGSATGTVVDDGNGGIQSANISITSCFAVSEPSTITIKFEKIHFQMII